MSESELSEYSSVSESESEEEVEEIEDASEDDFLNEQDESEDENFDIEEGIEGDFGEDNNGDDDDFESSKSKSKTKKKKRKLFPFVKSNRKILGCHDRELFKPSAKRLKLLSKKNLNINHPCFAEAYNLGVPSKPETVFTFCKDFFEECKAMLELEIENITNPVEGIEDENYPCPRCKGIKIVKKKVQDRSQDEGASLRIWCQASNCKYNWRITG